MGLLDTTLDIGAAAMAAAITHVGLAAGNPGSSGTSNPTTAAKLSVNWSTPSGGDFHNASDLAFTGGAGSGAVQYVTLWQGSTFRGSQQIPSGVGYDLNFNAAGEYVIPAGALVINGSATP